MVNDFQVSEIMGILKCCQKFLIDFQVCRYLLDPSRRASDAIKKEEFFGPFFESFTSLALQCFSRAKCFGDFLALLWRAWRPGVPCTGFSHAGGLSYTKTRQSGPNGRVRRQIARQKKAPARSQPGQKNSQPYK